jgi:LysM repeat protein
MSKLRFTLLLILLLTSGGVFSQETENPNLTVYVVQHGDTLTKIAETHGLTVNDIARANGIANPAGIRVGQRLLIPFNSTGVVLPPETHTVKPGDTLFNISRVYGVELQTLADLNGLANPNAIHIGQELVIRPETAAAPGMTVDETVETSNPTTTATHTIQRGETLFSIALRYQVTMDSIQAANGIEDPSRIFAGQELTIPGAVVDVPTTDLPVAMTAVEVTPLILTEGKTGRLKLRTRSASSVSVVFLERVLPVISQENNTSHVVWLAIPLKTAGGVYPLVVNVTEAELRQCECQPSGG